jgi:hypothetical protein
MRHGWRRSSYRDRSNDSARIASAALGRIGPIDGDAMSAVAPGLLLASGVQGGHERATDTLQIMLLIAAMVLASGLIFMYLRRQHRRSKPVNNQWQAQAVMGELCPHGWQAHITLYGWGAPVPADAPPARAPLVELEWKQFDEEPGRIVVARRVWAPSIGEALQTMVDDRRTDFALEQIEQEATGDDELWWLD